MEPVAVNFLIIGSIGLGALILLGGPFLWLGIFVSNGATGAGTEGVRRPNYLIATAAFVVALIAQGAASFAARVVFQGGLGAIGYPTAGLVVSTFVAPVFAIAAFAGVIMLFLRANFLQSVFVTIGTFLAASAVVAVLGVISDAFIQPYRSLFFTLFLPMAIFLEAILLGAWLLIPISLVASVAAVVLGFAPVIKVPTKYLVRNLQVRWWIPLITSLSVALVIFLTTWMFAIVKGMYRLTEGTGHPANIMVLADGATDEAFSSLPGGFSVELLDSEVRKFIAKGANNKYLVAKEVYVIVTHQLPNAVEGGRQRRFVQMRGLEDPEVAAEVHGIELASGRWFSSTGVPEVVLGDGVAKTFGQDVGKESLEPGDEVKIGKLTWKVVGVMSALNATFASEIWVLDKVVQNNFGRENSYSSYVARTVQLMPTKKQTQTSTVEARVASKLLKETRAEGRALSAQPEREYYAKLTQTNQQFLYAYLFIAAVIAIGGVLGVMITMFAAVSQRAKDIGVLRLIGFRRWQILLAFLFESLVIALLGGLIGLALGYVVFNGQTLSSIVSSGQGGGKSVVLRLDVDSFIAAIDISFALLMGAVGGFVPAFNAMRLRPLESLR